MVIPAARVEGGGGGGEGTGEGEGQGAGFGLRASPVGAFVIRKGEVAWVPALDLNKVIFWGQMTGIALFLVVRSILRSRR